MRIKFDADSVEFSYQDQTLTFPRGEYQSAPGDIMSYAVFFFLHW